MLPPTREEKKAKRRDFLKQRRKWTHEQLQQEAARGDGSSQLPQGDTETNQGMKRYLEKRRELVAQLEREKAVAKDGLPQEEETKIIPTSKQKSRLEIAGGQMVPAKAEAQKVPPKAPPRDVPPPRLVHDNNPPRAHDHTTQPRTVARPSSETRRQDESGRKASSGLAEAVKEMQRVTSQSDGGVQAKSARSQPVTDKKPSLKITKKPTVQAPSTPPKSLKDLFPEIPEPTQKINFDQQLHVFLAGKSGKGFFKQSSSPAADLAQPSRFSVRPTWMPFEPSTQLTPLPKKPVLRKQPPVRETAAPLTEASKDDDSYAQLGETANEVDSDPALHPVLPKVWNDDKKRPDFTPKSTANSNNLLDHAKIPLLSRKPRTDPRADTSPDGLHRLLFPEAESSIEKLQQRESQTTQDAQSGVEVQGQTSEDAMFGSLRNEIRTWIPESQQSEITAPAPGTYGSHATVVTLSGASPSLVDTDFYRILPASRHVEGWAGGLIKIVQARDPLSHFPIGHYYLMFHSRPAADAFVSEARRLYSLARRLLHPPPNSGVIPVRGPRSVPSPTPFLTPDEKAAAQRFTLCPPTMPLRLHTNAWNARYRAHLASRATIADVTQPLRPEALTPAKVLLNIRGRQQGHALEGGHGMTADELWLTLRDDGRERGSPWVLAPGLREGLRPVRTVVWPEKIGQQKGKLSVGTQTLDLGLEIDQAAAAEEEEAANVMELGQPIVGELVPPPPPRAMTGGEPNHQQEEEEGEGTAPPLTLRERRYNRYVLTFAQPAMARRFVRAWHRRAVWDGELRRVFVVDAVSLVS